MPVEKREKLPVKKKEERGIISKRTRSSGKKKRAYEFDDAFPTLCT